MSAESQVRRKSAALRFHGVGQLPAGYQKSASLDGNLCHGVEQSVAWVGNCCGVVERFRRDGQLSVSDDQRLSLVV